MKQIPKQRSSVYSYVAVGKLLYLATLLFIVECLVYSYKVKTSLFEESWIVTAFWLWSLMFSFIHIFLVLMDGWSRFQNYKRIKDHLFQHGFSRKTVKFYSGSKCQRAALMVAANELGMEKEVRNFYSEMGIKWYYFIPSFMLKDPLFLFRKYFWSRTFLEKRYTPKYDYHLIYRQHNDLIG